MTMSNSARQTATVGEITSLMSVDCQRIQDAFTYSQFTVSLPFITAGKQKDNQLRLNESEFQL